MPSSSSSLSPPRWRGQLPPLRNQQQNNVPSDNHHHQEQREEHQNEQVDVDFQSRYLQDSDATLPPFDVLYISPCQIAISNDPLNPDTIVAIPCNRTKFECPVPNVTAQSTLFVDFDYELHYTLGSNLTQTITALEGSMLNHLATLVGLDDCIDANVTVATASGGGNRQRQRNLQQPFFTPEEQALFVTVSSDNGDVPDPDFCT